MSARPRYVIRRADLANVLTRKALEALVFQCFKPGELHRSYKPDAGAWWLVWHQADAIGFGSITPSVRWEATGYLSLAGVLPEHRGHGLQRRLICTRLHYARQQHWRTVITETVYDNPQSANNLIACGFRQYVPEIKWNPRAAAVYWRKELA